MSDPGYELDDPRPNKREAPYTFYLPGDEQLEEVAAGVLVQLIFRAVPQTETYDAERMWVKVDHRDGDVLSGTLDNEPVDIPGLALGDSVSFRLHHIIDIVWQDPAQKERFETDFNNWFARCFVDKAVLEGRARAGFLYREEPEHKEDDRYPDTGWRIRADVDELSDEEYDQNPSPSYVAIGAVLNKDDSFVDLLSAPVGSAFLRGEGNVYEPTDLELDEDEE